MLVQVTPSTRPCKLVIYQVPTHTVSCTILPSPPCPSHLTLPCLHRVTAR